MYACFQFVYTAFFMESLAVVIMFFAFLFVLILSSALAYRYASGSIFFAVIAILLGVAVLVLKGENIHIVNAMPLFAFLFIAVGVAYLLFFVCVKLSLRRKRIRAEREIKARELRYELPQRDNTFVRARLGGMYVDEGGEGKDVVGDMKLRFTYAQNLLGKIRLQALGTTERMEMDELAGVFAVYAKKEGYVKEDVRLINDAFSRVLKLAAKYAV